MPWSSTTRQNVRTRLWTIQRTGQNTASTSPVSDMASLVSEFERAMKALFSNVEAELIIALNLLRDHFAIPALGLKQFRDITDPSRAAFQSIVEAPLALKKFRSASLLGDSFSFILNDLASHPVAQETGLAIGPQNVSFAFWLYADMVLGTGTTNWTSGS